VRNSTHENKKIGKRRSKIPKSLGFNDLGVKCISSPLYTNEHIFLFNKMVILKVHQACTNPFMSMPSESTLGICSLMPHKGILKFDNLFFFFMAIQKSPINA
jgi:hypothetical protein